MKIVEQNGSSRSNALSHLQDYYYYSSSQGREQFQSSSFRLQSQLLGFPLLQYFSCIITFLLVFQAFRSVFRHFAVLQAFCSLGFQLIFLAFCSYVRLSINLFGFLLLCRTYHRLYSTVCTSFNPRGVHSVHLGKPF